MISCKNNYVIRTDASLHIGSGHVMRCLAIADELRGRGGNVRFICREHPGNLCGLIEARGFCVTFLPLMESIDSLAEMHDGSSPGSSLGTDWETDANQTIETIQTSEAVDWLIVDHYAINILWEEKVRDSVTHIMVIDDLADREHSCDLLLDQNYVSNMESRYDQLVPGHCKKLLGPRYALLRPEFSSMRKALRRCDGTMQRILVFFGGMDSTNETSKAIQALLKLPHSNIQVDVVLGGSSPNHDEVQRLCSSSANYRFYCQVSNMAELMASADLSIGAGGGTMWERCCLGLPSIVVSVADNQHRASEAIALAGGILYLGACQTTSVDRIANALEFASSAPYLLVSMSEAGKKLVDGLGVGRVVRQLVTKQILLHRAKEEDCERIYSWRNSEETRRFSINSVSIPYETHIQWYKEALVDPNRAILIGKINGEPVGVLRYERDGERATVSVYLLPGKKGMGIGVNLIEEGSLWIESNWPDLKEVYAHIDKSNDASRAAFRSAGFDKQLYTYVKKIRD